MVPCCEEDLALLTFLLRTEPGSPAQEKEVGPTKPALMPSLPPLANRSFRHTHEHRLVLQQSVLTVAILAQGTVRAASPVQALLSTFQKKNLGLALLCAT